ncbi:MAG: hypothetical protein M3T49_08270 [Candidatus Eremiobacteraeota bacterium]|nr:hypothetical protein [Candidatus Eremiobacteraeota bacterium]
MKDHPYAELAAFALGSLEGDAATVVLDHADRCPTCAVVMAEMLGAVDAFGAGEAARPTLRTLANSQGSRRPARPGWPGTWRPLAAAASLAAAAILGAAVWNDRIAAQRLDVPVIAMVHSHFIHHALRGPLGSAKVLQAADGSWLYLVGMDLEPRGRYELWETRNGSTSLVGDFSASDAGEVAHFWPQLPGAVRALIVTRAGVKPAESRPELRWP